MSRVQIVILGGGTGGTMTANRLRRRFDADEAEIHVVDRDDRHVYQPGLLFVPFGLAQVDEIIRPRRRQLRDGVVFHENEVEFSAYHFEVADPDSLFLRVTHAAEECRRCIEARLPLPAAVSNASATSSKATALIRTPAPNAMIRPSSRSRIGTASAIAPPRISDEPAKRPQANALHMAQDRGLLGSGPNHPIRTMTQMSYREKLAESGRSARARIQRRPNKCC